jgi:hypothetical protein
VLSPIGVNVRSAPSRSAPVVGTAAQGTQLTVLGHSDQGSGWFEVKGATLTGWMSADPSISAPGSFLTYTSSGFNALYPAAWTSSGSPPAAVVFRAPAGAETVTFSSAPNVAGLPKHPAGYGVSQSQQVVACGVTGNMLTFVGSGGAGPYFIELDLALDAQHALGIEASLTDPAHVETVLDFVYSVTFPFPECQGPG